MRDKKDNATFDLPGFEPAAPPDPALAPAPASEPRRAPRARRAVLRQVQLTLLEETDTTGLPVWKRDEQLDLTGLPVWAPDPQ